MKFGAVLSFSMAVIAATVCSQASAVTVQTGANVFGGRPFLYVEGESASTINGTGGDYNSNGAVDAGDYVLWSKGGPLANEVDAPGTVNGADYTAWRARFGNAANSWKVVNTGGPEMSINTGTPVPIMPTGNNASGNSAITARGNDFGDSHIPNAIYEVQFITAGTYQLYPRMSLYDSNNNTNFLNEDSAYFSPAFNKNSGTDWIGHSSLEFDENDPLVDIPITGDSLDPDGWKTTLGDHTRDGLLELANWGIKDKGVWVQHSPIEATGVAANGKFAWYNRPAYQGTKPPGNTFDGFFGKKVEFEVTPAMVGQTVTFELGMREVNVTFDGFLFINMGTPADIYPNLDLLDLYTQAEVDAAILPAGSGASLDTTTIPEPATAVLFVLGLAAFSINRRR